MTDSDMSNAFFKPKPGMEMHSCGDTPCSIDRFSCTQKWWEMNIKTPIEMVEDECGKQVTIDTDDLDDKGTVSVRLDGDFVMTATNKEECSVIIRTIYSMLVLSGNEAIDV